MMNRTRCLALLLATLAVAGPAWAQREKPKGVSKSVAMDIRKEFTSEYKSKNVQQRQAAVDRLSPFKHELIVKCLERAMRDADASVRVAAAQRLGTQTAKPALKVLGKAFKDRRNGESPETMVSILQAYRAHRRSPPLKPMKRLFDQASKEVQREVVITLRYVRNKDTVKFLAQLIDTPQPRNVDAGQNPPASYWKDRVTRWSYWFSGVSTTLVHLTGREFDSNKEARGWATSSSRILSVAEGDKAVKDL